MAKVDKIKKIRVRAHELIKDDVIKVGGNLYQVYDIGSYELMAGQWACTLRPVGVDSYHQDARLYIKTLAKLTVYREPN